LARDAHAGQFRQDGKTPYVMHPVIVAMLLADIAPEANTQEAAAAALLHDVLEDTKVTYDDLVREVGKEVADLVQWLTNPSKGSKLPRAERKRMDREHLAQAPAVVKLIKLLDRFHNVMEVETGGDLGWRKLYATESGQLLEVLKGTHARAESLLGEAIDLLKVKNANESR
jgi:(p)ppGpp synthase/HD superfamily hydrolase